MTMTYEQKLNWAKDVINACTAIVMDSFYIYSVLEEHASRDGVNLSDEEMDTFVNMVLDEEM